MIKAPSHEKGKVPVCLSKLFSLDIYAINIDLRKSVVSVNELIRSINNGL